MFVVQPAESDGERIVAAICMLSGAFVFAYVVGNVFNIATTLSADTNECVNHRYFCFGARCLVVTRRADCA